jgi:hypothetical protein
MKLLRTLALPASAILVLLGSSALAHPGPVDGSRCHVEKATGKRHCHKDRRPTVPEIRPFASCEAARAAKATPLNRGRPGYSAKLDRDGDGKACD